MLLKQCCAGDHTCRLLVTGPWLRLPGEAWTFQRQAFEVFFGPRRCRLLRPSQLETRKTVCGKHQPPQALSLSPVALKIIGFVRKLIPLLKKIGTRLCVVYSALPQQILVCNKNLSESKPFDIKSRVRMYLVYCISPVRSMQWLDDLKNKQRSHLDPLSHGQALGRR